MVVLGTPWTLYVGAIAAGVFFNPEGTLGKTIGVAGDEYAATFSKVLGTQVVYELIALPMSSSAYTAHMCVTATHIILCGAMPEHRIAALDAIGFVWDAQEYQWQKMFMFKLLLDHEGQHGRGVIYGPLGKWVHSQLARKAAKAGSGRKAMLASERVV